jgi:nucleotide-binding universal stress UspA family protein
MKTLLVPVPEQPSAAVFECAISFAHVFGSLVEGMALAPDLSRTIAAEFPIDPHYIDPDNRRDMVTTARRHFEQQMQQAQLPRCADKVTGPCYRWAMDELGEDGRVASYARLFDLVVLARPEQRRDGSRIATVETILFESGRPVLLVPPAIPKAIGRRVVIAWNGSLETARAIAFAMPILLQAERVIVLHLEGWEVDGPRASDQVEFLKRHGVNAELASRPLVSGPGESIMKQAHDLGADLIIKGAYTQSRLRQMIFGGATSHLLAHTDVPMFIAH